MSTLYHVILRGVAHRVGALRGEYTPSIETSFVATPLTAAELAEKTPYSLSVLKDAVLEAEEMFVVAIASTGNHPWRAVLRAFTANIADKGVVPAVDSTGKGIVGLYGAVRDATDSTPLVEMPLSMIARRVRNANNHYLLPVYWYKFDGGVVRHTRTNITIEVCSYDRAAQSTALNANSAMLLPDALGSALVQYAACLLDPKHSSAYADAMIGAIKAGNMSTVPRSVPMPVTLEKAG